MISKTKLRPVIIILLLNIIFFYRGLLPNKIIASTDILQTIPTFSISGYVPPINTIPFDQTTQYLPWSKYLKENLFDLSLLKINPFNSNGAPFLANPQTAALFPLSYIFVLFNFKEAIVIDLISKLFLIGFFTYLYLREIKFSVTLSLLGSAAFNFGGFNMVWGLAPMSNALVFFPLTLLLLEKIMNNNIAHVKSIVLLAIIIFFLALSGHPETAFHIVFISIIYMIIRCYFKKQNFIKVIKLFFIGLFFGLILSSFYWLPFVEYLLKSQIFNLRSTVTDTAGLPLFGFILNIYPNLFGNPTTNYYHPLASFSNFNEYAGGYVFPIFYLLTFIYLIKHFMRQKLFSKIGILITFITLLSLIYSIPLLNWKIIPLFGSIAHHRLLFALSFFVVVFGLKQIEKRIKIPGYIFILLTVIGVVLYAFIFIKPINELITQSLNFTEKIREFIFYQLNQILIFFGFLAVSLFALYLNNKNFIKANITHCFLIFLVFINSWLLFNNYLSLTNTSYFYPETNVIKFIQSLPRGKFADIGDLLIPANVNLWYKFNFVDNYDAIEYKADHQEVDELLPNRRTPSYDFDLNSLNELNIKYLASLLPIDKQINFIQPIYSTYEPLNNDKQIIIEFNPINTMVGFVLKPVNYNRVNLCSYNIKIIDKIDSKVLIDLTESCKDIFDRHNKYFEFPIPLKTNQHDLELIISTSDSQPNNQIGFTTDDFGNPYFGIVYSDISRNYLKQIYGKEVKIYEVVY